MELTSSNVDTAVACFDPECIDEAGSRSVAEPEQDGDLSFYCCTTCGGEFGYRHTRPTPTGAATCAAGIPEDLRRRASAPMEGTLARQAPLLQIRRRDAPAS